MANTNSGIYIPHGTTSAARMRGFGGKGSRNENVAARSAFEKGASYSRIPNLSFWGEDRHFSIRAGALGIGLWVDTHFPVLHLFAPGEFTSFRGLASRYPTEEGMKLLFLMDAAAAMFTVGENSTGAEGLPFLAPAFRSGRAAAMRRSAEQARTRGVQNFCFPFTARHLDADRYRVDCLQIMLRNGTPNVQTRAMGFTLGEGGISALGPVSG